MKDLLGEGSGVEVSSAGIFGEDYGIRGDVRDYLRKRGIDVSGHRPRRLSKKMADEADLVVAMDHDHKEFIERKYGIKARLFMELCTGKGAALPDIEVVPGYQDDPPAVGGHIRRTMDVILENLPRLTGKIAEIKNLSD